MSESDYETVVMGAVNAEGEVELENPNIIENPTITQVNEGPLSSLNEEQRTRVGALNMARPLLTDRGPLGGVRPPDLSDLMRLAQWILDGNDEPLYPYLNGDVLVIGPNAQLSRHGDVINWQGKNFYVQEDEDA